MIAPYEADNQLAFMYHKGRIHGVVADDADFLCMGCRVIRYFNTRKGTATEYDLARASDSCESPLVQLVAQHGVLALRVFSNLAGNDYTGLAGLLPKGHCGAIRARHLRLRESTKL